MPRLRQEKTQKPKAFSLQFSYHFYFIKVLYNLYLSPAWSVKTKSPIELEAQWSSPKARVCSLVHSAALCGAPGCTCVRSAPIHVNGRGKQGAVFIHF